METVTDVQAPELSIAATREWTQHVESILRGLAHALNNRAAALSAMLELSSEPDDDPEVTRSILGTELARVRELAEMVRLIGPPWGALDAISPRDVLPEVLGVLRLHADQRERTITIDGGSAPPVRVVRWMLQRALIVLCASAPTSDPARRTLRATLTEDGDWLVARVDPAEQPAPDSAYVAELARGMGGEPIPGGFRIPTLAAIRRREGR